MTSLRSALGSRTRRSAKVIAVAFVSTALLVPSTASAVTPAPPGTDLAKWSAVSIPPGQIDAAVASLDGIAQRVMAQTGVPGMSISVVHDGQTVYAKGFGVRDVTTSAPVDADTVFQLASMSKPIGASVIAAVMRTTDIKWTDPVVEHLPWFTLSDPYVTTHATIGDMYAMRSGLPHEAGDDIAEFGYTRRQIIERLRYLPLAPFRAKHLYANYSVTIGAEAVAQAVGVPWNRLSEERLYRPLGMTSTTSDLDVFRRFANHATLHVPVGDTWVANGVRDEEAQSPAGMVASSANDLAKWMTMELANGAYGGRQVADATALQQTRIPRSLTTPNADPQTRAGFYGYGTAIRTDATGRVRWQHSGAFSQGAATTFVLLPSENLGITVLTNGYPVGAPESVAAEFLDLVELGTVSTDWLQTNTALFASVLGGSNTPPAAPSNPRPSGPLAQYVGVYGNRFYGDVVIKRKADGLVAVIGPLRVPMPLVPLDGRVFAMPGSTAPVATFTTTGGKVSGLELAFFSAPGQTLLTRRG